jgi:hypothetical protein
MAQASELSQMDVANLRGSQLSRQGLPVEVRVVSRSGNTAYVYDALDAVRPKKIEEVFPCPIRMSNRQDRGLLDFGPSHDDYPFLTDPSRRRTQSCGPRRKRPGCTRDSVHGLLGIARGPAARRKKSQLQRPLACALLFEIAPTRLEQIIQRNEPQKFRKRFQFIKATKFYT